MVEARGQTDGRYKALQDAVMSGFSKFTSNYEVWPYSLKNHYIREFIPHTDHMSTEVGLWRYLYRKIAED